MNWYYAAGGQQQGPIDDAQLDALIQSGTVTPDTLVWREGMANWLPLRQARPSAESATGSSPAGAPPVASPLSAAHSDDFHVPQPPPATVFVGEEELLSRDYRIEIGECIERGWKAVTGNFGVVIISSFLVGLVYGCGFLVSSLARFVIPFADSILPSIFVGPLFGGFMFMLLKLLRGEDATVGDAFSGFSRNGLQLMLTSIVQGLIGLACFLPVLIVIGAGGSGFGMQPDQFNLPKTAGGVILVVALLLAGIATMIYITTVWMHSLLLIADKGYKFWPAMQLSRRMVSKRWWMTFLFLIVGGVISGVGFLACCIGLLVSLPVYFAMIASLYNDNFRDLAPAADID